MKHPAAPGPHRPGTHWGDYHFDPKELMLPTATYCLDPLCLVSAHLGVHQRG